MATARAPRDPSPPPPVRRRDRHGRLRASLITFVVATAVAVFAAGAAFALHDDGEVAASVATADVGSAGRAGTDETAPPLPSSAAASSTTLTPAAPASTAAPAATAPEAAPAPATTGTTGSRPGPAAAPAPAPPPPEPAPAPPAPVVESGAAAQLVGLVNGVRAGVGLPPLAVNGELSANAQRWAASMAAAGVMSHQGDLSVGLSAPWVRLGENVGVGPTIGAVHAALVASPGHYANITDPGFGSIGVGVVAVGGQLYVAEEFMQT